MGTANPNGEQLKFVQATPEQQAVIERCLDEQGQRPGASASPELRSGGAKLVGVFFVLAGGASAKLKRERSETTTATWAAPRNLLRKEGSSWKVVFNGAREFFIADTFGAHYLDYLLHHPNQPISAFDLERLVRAEKAVARGKTSFDKGADANAVKAYLRRLDALRAQREKASRDGNETEARRLDPEIETIEKELEQASGAADTGERARNNVRKAIGLVVRTLLKGGPGEKAFGAHLRQFVSLGYEVCYSHADGQAWQ
jgi:hypothetical protein